MTGLSQSFLDEARSALLRFAVHDASVLAMGQFVSTGLGLLTTVVAARILGPEGYGQAVLILAFPSLLLSLGSFKSVTISARYMAAFRSTGAMEQLRAIAKLSYAVDVGAFAGVFLVVLIAGRWMAGYSYGAHWMYGPMVLYAASFPLLAFRGGSFAVFTAFEEFRRLSFLHVLERGLSLALVLALLLAGYGVTGMILGLAIANVLMGLVSVGLATSFLAHTGVSAWWRGSLESIGHLRRELASFFGWNYLTTSLSGAISEIPVILLGALRGAGEAGLFRLALSLMTASSYPGSAAGRVVYPRLSGRWAKGETEAELRRDTKRWTLRVGLPLGLLLLALIPLLRWVVPLLFGPGYRPVVGAVQLLFVAGAVSALFFWLSPYYYAVGHVARWTKGFALYTAFVLGAGWLSIRWWGFFGMAVVYASGTVVFLLGMATRVGNGRTAAERSQ